MCIWRCGYDYLLFMLLKVNGYTMETPALMVSDILNNALFQSSPRIDQTLRQIFHALHFCTRDWLLNHAPDFVVKGIEVRAVRQPQIWKFTPVTTISQIIALCE